MSRAGRYSEWDAALLSLPGDIFILTFPHNNYIMSNKATQILSGNVPQFEVQ